MIRRVMMATINYDHPQIGQRHAFSGIFGANNVCDFDYIKICDGAGKDQTNQLFIQHVKTFQPDWIWFQLQMTDIIQPTTILELRSMFPKMVVSHWMGDCRASVDPYLAKICQATHLSLVSNTGQIPMYYGVGAPRVEYCQIGVDWEEDLLGIPAWTPPFRVPEVVLLGHHYGKTYPGTGDREGAIRTLREAGIDAGVIGNGWPGWANPVGSCHVKQQYHVWTRAKVGLCVNNFNDVELHYSDRQVISMASGTPIVCYEVPGLRREFEDGRDCLMYRTPAELLKAVRSLLADETFRLKVGRAGRARIIRDHTWFSRITQILPVIEGIQETLK